VYGASNADAMPFTDDLMSGLSYKYTMPSDFSIGLPNPAWTGCPNPAGVTTNKYLLFDYFDFNTGTGSFDAVVGNFNASGSAPLQFEFDEAYQLYSASNVDYMYVKVSNDCGATWHTVWSASGSTLASITGTNTSGFVPASASDWAHRSVSIPASYTGSNMMVKFTGTSGYGNYAWVTNLRLAVTTAVQEVVKGDFISVTPNPAKDVAFVNLSMSDNANVTVDVYDAVGRVVNSVSKELAAGDQKIELSTANFAAGLYYVKISAGANTITKTLSVIK